MKQRVLLLLLTLLASQGSAVWALDSDSKLKADAKISDKAVANPSRAPIVGSDSPVLERRVEHGPMSSPARTTNITTGGDAQSLDRSGLKGGAKIPGPSGTINNKSELPSTKQEVGGGAVMTPAQ